MKKTRADRNPVGINISTCCFIMPITPTNVCGEVRFMPRSVSEHPVKNNWKQPVSWSDLAFRDKRAAVSSTHVGRSNVKGQRSASCSSVPQWPPARPSTTSTPTGCSGFLGSQTAPGRIHTVPKVAPRNTRAGQQAAARVCRGTRSTCPKRCTAPFKACAPDPSWKNKRQRLKSVAHQSGPIINSQNLISRLFFRCFFLSLAFILNV